ncbi:hypothetical protein LTR85_011740 [Meristemomyces frigidus]|nr:hypothetical protein LTR85_011740 [Meristemomyces frigidus]
MDAGAVGLPSGHSKLLHPEFPYGVGTVIRYARSLYTKLSAATSGHADDLPLLRSVQLEFAIVLVHEVFHALFNAIHHVQDHEPFFGRAAIAEVGYEAEVRLFGGHITQLFNESTEADQQVRLYYRERKLEKLRKIRSLLRGVPVVWDWPYNRIVLQYQGEKHNMLIRRSRMPKTDLAWRIPLDYLGQMFTNAHWHGPGAKRDTKLLHIDRDIGYCFYTNTVGALTPQKLKRLRYRKATTWRRVPRGTL